MEQINQCLQSIGSYTSEVHAENMGSTSGTATSAAPVAQSYLFLSSPFSTSATSATPTLTPASRLTYRDVRSLALKWGWPIPNLFDGYKHREAQVSEDDSEVEVVEEKNSSKGAAAGAGEDTGAGKVDSPQRNLKYRLQPLSPAAAEVYDSNIAKAEDLLRKAQTQQRLLNAKLTVQKVDPTLEPADIAKMEADKSEVDAKIDTLRGQIASLERSRKEAQDEYNQQQLETLGRSGGAKHK